MLYGYMSNIIILCMRNTGDKSDKKEALIYEILYGKKRARNGGNPALINEKLAEVSFRFFCVFVGIRTAEVS